MKPIIIIIVLVLATLSLAAVEQVSNLTLPEDSILKSENQTINETKLLLPEKLNLPLPIQPPEEQITNITPSNSPSEDLVKNTTLPVPQLEAPFPVVGTIIQLLADRVKAVVGEIITLQATLKYENNTPLEGRLIEFYAGTLLGSNQTNEEGKASLAWNTTAFLPDKYTLKAVSPDNISASLKIILQAEEKQNIASKEVVSPSYKYIYEQIPQEVAVYREETISIPEVCYAENKTCVPAREHIKKIFDHHETKMINGTRIGVKVGNKVYRGYVNVHNNVISVWSVPIGDRNFDEYGKCREYEIKRGVCEMYDLVTGEDVKR